MSRNVMVSIEGHFGFVIDWLEAPPGGAWSAVGGYEPGQAAPLDSDPEIDELATRARTGDRAALDALVARAKGGERAALEALLSMIAPQVARFGWRLCGRDSADVDDALQDALVAVASRLGEYEGRSSLSTWVFTLVRTACARRRRGVGQRVTEPLESAEMFAHPGPGPEADAERMELRRALESALDSLSDEHREVLALRDVEGLSAKEAADVVGLTVPALKSRLHRARAALRDRLAPALAPSAPRPAPDCPDVLAALSAKLEDDLAPEACALLEQHVGACAACASVCDSLRAALGLCREVGRDGAAPPVGALRDHIRAALGAIATSEGRTRA